MASTRIPSASSGAGAVFLGNGTWPSRFLRSVAQALRVKQSILARSTAAGSPFNGTVVPVYKDGSVAGGNASAKTFLQGRSIKQLKGPRVTSLTGKLLRT